MLNEVVWVVGIFTIGKWVSDRWPGGLDIAMWVIGISSGILFFWLFLWQPWLEGYREASGKHRDSL